MSLLPPEEPHDPGKGLHPDLAGLDFEVSNATSDPEINAFISMYNMMPERIMNSVVGSTIVVDGGLWLLGTRLG